MEKALIARLLSVAALTSLVGNRINWVQRKQGEALSPYVILTKISGVTDTNYTAPEALKESRVQIDCYAKTYEAAIGVARAIDVALSGYSGVVASAQLQGVFKESERDIPAWEQDTERLYRRSMDFNIWHKEI